SARPGRSCRSKRALAPSIPGIRREKRSPRSSAWARRLPPSSRARGPPSSGRGPSSTGISSGCGASRPSLSATDEKGAFRPLSAPGPRGRSADVAHAEADATLTVDLEHLDLDDIAFLKLVADPLHALLGAPRCVHEAVLARQNRDEGSEVHQANHLALVDPADLDLGGDHLDALFRCTPRSRVARRDLDRAVVLD